MIRLLIVDDEIASIKIIKAFVNFKKYGIELIGEAENGVEAMNIIESNNCPDILITDMNMPVMDGISLLQYLIDCNSRIKIIVISGYYDFPYTHVAIKANVHDYLLKPLKPDLLNQAIAGCVDELTKSQGISAFSPKNSLKTDLKTYQKILKYEESMRLAMAHGNENNIIYQLNEIRNFLRLHDSKEVLLLVYQLIGEALNRYCIEENCNPPVIPDLNIDTVLDPINAVLLSLQELYLNKYKEILESKKKKSANSILAEVHEYLENYYKNNIRLDTIAEKYYVNKEYLSSLFHKKYGETISDFVIRLKMEDAKRQLQYSQSSVKDIAYSLGYTDPCYFNKQFKKTVGITPGQYQKMIKKGTLV